MKHQIIKILNSTHLWYTFLPGLQW